VCVVNTMELKGAANPREILLGVMAREWEHGYVGGWVGGWVGGCNM